MKQVIFNTVFLLPVRQLLPHEYHDDEHARKLAEVIRLKGAWTHPILAESKSRIILDGHHRTAAAKLLSLVYLPVYLIDYDSNQVCVDCWNSKDKVTKSDVIYAGKNGELMPIMTSRHTGTFVTECQHPIDNLM